MTRKSKRERGQELAAASDALAFLLRPAWQFATTGWRRFVVLPAVVGVALLTWLASGVESGRALVAWARSFDPPAGWMKDSELDVCNSWLIQVSEHPDADAAAVEADRIDRLLGEHGLEAEVHAVRHPLTHHRHMVVLDTNKGAMSKVDVDSDLLRFRTSNGSSAGDAIRNALISAQATYYSSTQFEETFGPQGTPCRHRDVFAAKTAE